MPASRLVGEAYVLMRADGRLLKRDMKKAGGEAGEASGADWRKAFDKEIEQSAQTMQNRCRRSLSDAFVGNDFSQFRKEFGSVEATVDGLRAKLKKMTFGPDGKALPIKDRQLLKKTYDEIVASLEAWGDAETEVERKQRESVGTTKRLTQLFKEQGAALSVLTVNREKAAKAADDKALVDSTKRLTQFFKDQNATLKVLSANRLEQEKILEKAIHDQDRAYTTYAHNVEAGETLHARQFAETTRRLMNQGQQIRDNTRDIDAHASHWVQSARNIRIGLDNTADRVDHFSELTGRAFGKGSRNNFLNWVGSMVGGMLRVGNAIITFPAKAISHVVDSFGSAFTEASKTLGFFASVGKGIGAVFGGGAGIVGVLGGAAAGFFALTKVLPSVISLLTLMAGAATALVGSIGIGLTGALLGLVPAAAGAAAGLGSVFGVIATFVNDKSNKDFVKNLFTDPFKKFSKQFYPQVRTFLTSFSGGFKRVLADLQPGVDTFFDTFEKRFKDADKFQMSERKDKKGNPIQGPMLEIGTLTALDKWSTSLGNIAVQLNSAVTSFGSGLIAFFVPVLPYAERLATWINQIADKFDHWASSVGGQNAISEFMQAAWKDAKLVFDILGEIAGIFGTVFSSGDDAGATFLTGIRDKLKEINDFLKTPEGRSKLDDFFGDAKQLGTDIGSIATSIGGLVKDLSSPEGRQGAKDIMGSIKELAKDAGSILSVTTAVTNMLDKIQAVAEKLNPLMNPIKSLFEFGGKLVDKSREHDAAPKPTPTPKEIPKLGIEGLNEAVAPKQTTPFVPGRGPVIDAKVTVNGFSGNGAAGKALGALGLTPEQITRLAGYVIPISTDTKAYDETKAIIQAFKFSGKQVPVDGNEAAWNVVKGTVAGYAFKAKVVPIRGDASALNATIETARKKLRSLGVTVPIAGAGRQGGLTLGDSAAGRIVTGPHLGLTGEAGPEAIVPLNRPLHLVDPSVRALSAIAQGLQVQAPMGAGGIAGAGGGGAQVVFEAGAITTAAQNPAIVASMVKDDLVLALS